MNIKWGIIPCIIVADIVSKNLNDSGIGDHYTKLSLFRIGMIFLISLYFVYIRSHFTLPLIVCFTGAILNYSDSLDGKVINPIVLIVRDSAVAFNVADVSIIAGSIWIVYIVLGSLFGGKLKNGSVQWKNV